MIDKFNRNIDYMRISVTDRCNLRCYYCMPNGIESTSHDSILTYEELLVICREAVSIGIHNFKITGGEPLVRKGVTDFIKKLKQIPGVKKVTITTNGVLLEKYVEELKMAGIDAINVSLDSCSAHIYHKITGSDEFESVWRGICKSYEAGIKTKINCVLGHQTQEEIIQLAMIAKDKDINIRFIELMPIGEGENIQGMSPKDAKSILLKEFPDLYPVNTYEGNGPAYYESSSALKGKIGWISAMSHVFCDSCNRIRLTSEGVIKPCLCYGEGLDLKRIIRHDSFELEQLTSALKQAVYNKPKSHCFDDKKHISENRKMVQIGG